MSDVDMTAVAAVRRDLERLPDELAQSALAATMLAMAERLDGGGGSPSECAKALADAWSKLRDLAPVERKRDGVDELSRARADRIAGGARAKG